MARLATGTKCCGGGSTGKDKEGATHGVSVLGTDNSSCGGGDIGKDKGPIHGSLRLAADNT
jgi:hypothetical protein